MTELRGPGTLPALLSLLVRSPALRHPRLARDAALRGLPGVIRLAAARHPERIALRRGDDAVTAARLDDEVRAVAAGLDVAPGSRVGVRSDGGIGYVVALASALAAGAEAVPLGPRLAPADVDGLRLDRILDPSRGAASHTRAGVRTRVQPTAARTPGRLLLLTTGTTGTPVATARGRLGMRALGQLADAERRARLPRGPVLLLAPPDHGHGLSTLAAALLRGLPVVLASGLPADAQAALVARHAPASIVGVPAQLARLLDAGGIGPARAVVSGSSPLTPALRARLEADGATVHDGFGSTATGTVAIDGHPLAGVRLRVTATGELEVRSPLGGDRWIATGDRAEIVDGRLQPRGRVGGLVDSGGELVDPSRLRALLLAQPGVADAAVTVVPDDLLGSVLHARVDADPALESALRGAIASTLARAEHPRRLGFGPVA